VIQKIEADHKRKSPKCKVPVRELRVEAGD